MTFNNTHLVMPPMPIDIGWVGDTLTSCGLGITINQRWAQFAFLDGWKEGGGSTWEIVWLGTIAICLGIIMLRNLGLEHGRNYILWTNGTATESKVKKRCSRNTMVNNESNWIQDLLIDENYNILEERVNSSDTQANTLSRGEKCDIDTRKQLFLPLPADLRPAIMQVEYYI
jgi:hypothetical protein